MKTQSTKVAPHPFALMMDPQAVLAAVEGSQRLQGLSRHVYHPLDKPLIPHAPTEVDRYDSECDASDITTFGLPDDGYAQQ
ncbi:MAG: hypothetical protein RIQ60_176 [Pseudomonadota bacterium]